MSQPEPDILRFSHHSLRRWPALTIYALKSHFQDLLRSLVAPLPRIGVTANMVTIVAPLGSVVVGALGPALGASRRYEGPMGKSDRAVVFGALGLWIGCLAPLPAWLVWVVPILAALLVLTVVNRVRAGAVEARNAGSESP